MAKANHAPQILRSIGKTIPSGGGDPMDCGPVGPRGSWVRAADAADSAEAWMAEEAPKPASAETPSGAPVAPAAAPADAGAMAAQALGAAQEAVTNLKQEVAPVGAAGAPGKSPSPFELQSFGKSQGDAAAKGIDLLSDVNLNVKIELGRTRMLVEDVLKLSEGAVVELDKLAGDPVDVYVNDRHVARGEVLVLNDNFCVRINEIISGSDGEPGIERTKK